MKKYKSILNKPRKWLGGISLSTLLLIVLTSVMSISGYKYLGVLDLCR